MCNAAASIIHTCTCYNVLGDAQPRASLTRVRTLRVTPLRVAALAFHSLGQLLGVQAYLHDDCASGDGFWCWGS